MSKLTDSFGYAFKGIKYAVQTQLNFRIHTGATVLAVAAGCYLHLQKNEWLWVGLCITLVMAAELFNTAIELLTNIVSPEYNKKAGHVKDVAAGAVTIIALFAAAAGAVIFIPKILALF